MGIIRKVILIQGNGQPNDGMNLLLKIFTNGQLAALLTDAIDKITITVRTAGLARHYDDAGAIGPAFDAILDRESYEPYSYAVLELRVATVTCGDRMSPHTVHYIEARYTLPDDMGGHHQIYRARVGADGYPKSVFIMNLKSNEWTHHSVMEMRGIPDSTIEDIVKELLKLAILVVTYGHLPPN